MNVILPPPRSKTDLARRDLVEGLSRHWLWTALAIQDIRLRYRGSVLGPWWLTLSSATMVVVMGALYSKLFNTDPRIYVPFLAIGLVAWQFLSTLMAESCQTFLAVQTVMHQVRLPLSLHAYRVVFRNLLVLAHNTVIIPVVLLWVHAPFGLRALWCLPAIAVLAVNGVWICLLLGMVSARFRDVPPIVASVLQVVFFVTPIFWRPDSLGRWQAIGMLNPLFAAIDILRAPLLDQPTAPGSWPIVLAVTALGWLGTFKLFARFRGRVTYWV